MLTDMELAKAASVEPPNLIAPTKVKEGTLRRFLKALGEVVANGGSSRARVAWRPQ